jgi:tetrahydromethanopterin S-methyltransferase subunit F
MPLSEDEQRILRQIEEQLQRDPRFGRQARQASGAVTASPAIPLFGCIIGVVGCVLLLAVSPYLSFAVFAATVFCAAALWRRVAGTAGAAWTDGIRRFPTRGR